MPPVTHYSQLIVWKLAEEIRVKVFELTDKPMFAADLKAKRQVEDAANSVCRNIAEGFGCETHIEFARFLEIARRSLNEVQDMPARRTVEGIRNCHRNCADQKPLGEDLSGVQSATWRLREARRRRNASVLAPTRVRELAPTVR